MNKCGLTRGAGNASWNLFFDWFTNICGSTFWNNVLDEIQTFSRAGARVRATTIARAGLRASTKTKATGRASDASARVERAALVTLGPLKLGLAVEHFRIDSLFLWRVTL